MAYTPESEDHYQRMLTFLSTVETPEELRQALFLYIGDLSYPRPDIMMAERVIKRQKGWK
jgi:hypothetical protein